MAGITVSSLLQHLPDVLKYLREVIPQDESLLHEVEEKVSSLLGHLSLTNIFLQNSEGRRSEQEIMKEVVNQIRDAAHEAEDVIDEFIVDVAKHSTTSVCGRLIRGFDHKRMLRKVAMKTEAIKRKFSEIDDKREKYPIETNVDVLEEALHRYRREVEEDNVVGFDDDSTTLVKLLTEGNLLLEVVSIIGMAGLGKTTLARKIYNSTSVQNLFGTYRLWVDVSQRAEARELLLKILRNVPMSNVLRRKLGGLDKDDLRKTLAEGLKGKRYLIVLDDMWKPEVWDEVRSAFPDNSNGSRILITTRIRKVALQASHTSDPYVLPFLNKDKSWELLRKKVFRGRECPPQFEPLGRQLAEGCRGLPLSIVVLGGILATEERSHRVWSKIVGNVNRYLTEEPNVICKQILALSFTHLPQHLRPCFLYIGAYPEDSKIPVRQLMQLWSAEGFIRHNFYKDPEDVAEDYLKELINRSLLQVDSKRTDEGIKTCRIHDLLREFCISKSAEAKFLDVRTEFNHLSPNTSRRLSIQGGIDAYIPANLTCPISIRSLLFLNKDTYEVDPNHWICIFNIFKLARVLHFGYVDLYSISAKIEELILLRYLGTASEALKKLPASICNLTNLETLDMRGTSLDCLPKEIWKMRRLRNLYVSGPVSLPDCTYRDIQVLPSLQVLSTVSLDPQTIDVIAMLPNLKKLGLCFTTDESTNQARDVLDRLKDLRHLEILKVVKCFEPHILPISYPSAITKITLRSVRVKVRRDMRMLGKCANLRILKLQSCLLSSKLHVFADSFPQLQVLTLENLRIQRWKQRRRAMPFLKHLVIKKCGELTMLPSRLWRSNALRDVEILSSNSELAMMLQELEVRVSFNLLIYPS